MKRYRNSSDELYGMFELMEERFFKWIPSKEYKYYLEESIRLGKEEGRKEGIEEGKEEGIETATKRINRLNKCLIQDERFDDLRRSAEDADYQKRLIEEYNIE